MAKAKTNDMPVELPLEARIIRCISDFPAPATSQDTVDQQAAEYATASLLRQYAEKRFDAAKNDIMNDCAASVQQVRLAAAENMSKSTSTINGNEWAIILSANKPVTRLDVDVFKTELVRLGVNVKLIDEAETKAIKKNTPALSISAVR